MKGGAIVAMAAPSIGPAIVTLFGQDVPVLALGLSCAGLLLARVVAPPPLRRLTRIQHICLTLLLLLVLLLIVTGSFTGEPWATGWLSPGGSGSASQAWWRSKSAQSA